MAQKRGVGSLHDTSCIEVFFRNFIEVGEIALGRQESRRGSCHEALRPAEGDRALPEGPRGSNLKTPTFGPSYSPGTDNGVIVFCVHVSHLCSVISPY